MPANVVKTPHDEAAWTRAKAAVRRQYPSLNEDDDRFWKLTMHIFENMKALSPEDRAVPEGVQEQICAHVKRHGVGKSLTARRALASQCLRAWRASQAQQRGKAYVVLMRGGSHG
jgi:hypothetical protein